VVALVVDEIVEFLFLVVQVAVVVVVEQRQVVELEHLVKEMLEEMVLVI
jgi:hypothetical protein